MNVAFEKAMKLAVISGLKAALGPALLKTAQRRPDAGQWVAAAMGEMVLDKLGIVPSRRRLPLLIPHAISGAWVAAESMREDGVEDPWAAPMGAAVAAGVATFAPMLRVSASTILGIPDAVLGVAEDYLALKLGTETLGLSMDDVSEAAKESVEEIKERVLPAVQRVLPAAQSIGAGSM
jgi:hypothetical protein